MKIDNRLLLLIFIIAMGCNSSSEKTDKPVIIKDTGWQSLFNGKTLDGWHTYGKDYTGSAWKVDSGMLHLDASVKDDWQTKNGGDLVTDDEFENFHLKIEWKISPAGNSGLMFYVHEDTIKYKYPWESGPEMQINDPLRNPDERVEKWRAGDIYDILSATKRVVKPAGEWNQYEIIANNGDLNFIINGEQVLHTTLWNDEWQKLITNSKFIKMPGFGTYRKGRIALQDHGADIWFRNIEIKEL